MIFLVIILILIIIYLVNKESYPLSRLLDLPGDIKRWLKRAYQRSARGYSDEDVWDMDVWASEVIPAMLRDLAKHVTAHPQGCKNNEQWSRELKKMAMNIQAAYIFNQNNEPLSDDELQYREIDNDTVKRYIARNKRAANKTKKGLYQFANRFFELWD